MQDGSSSSKINLWKYIWKPVYKAKKAVSTVYGIETNKSILVNAKLKLGLKTTDSF